MVLTEIQKIILRFLQTDILLDSHPYRDIARSLHLSEDRIILEIKRLKKEGCIRRLGAILNHKKIGFKQNCICVWKVPYTLIKKIAGIARRQEEISHCYLRKTAKNWPYNFYTMIHGRTKQECRSIIESIAAKSGVSDYRMLFTLKEFKKTSPKYKM